MSKFTRTVVIEAKGFVVTAIIYTEDTMSGTEINERVMDTMEQEIQKAIEETVRTHGPYRCCY